MCFVNVDCKTNASKTEFLLNLSTIEVLYQINYLLWGAVLYIAGMFNSIPDNCTLLAVTTKNVSRCCSMSPIG